MAAPFSDLPRMKTSASVDCGENRHTCRSNVICPRTIYFAAMSYGNQLMYVVFVMLTYSNKGLGKCYNNCYQRLVRTRESAQILVVLVSRDWARVSDISWGFTCSRAAHNFTWSSRERVRSRWLFHSGTHIVCDHVFSFPAGSMLRTSSIFLWGSQGIDISIPVSAVSVPVIDMYI